MHDTVKSAPIAKVDPERLLRALEPTKVAQNALADLDAQRLAEREKLAKRLADIEVIAEEQFPRLTKAIDDALRTVAMAEKALVEARNKAATAASERSSAGFRFDRERSGIEAALSETAAPEIEAFIREMRAELTRPPQPTMIDETRRNPITGKRTELRTSNVAAIRQRLEAIRDAVTAAEDMRLEPDQSTIPERLAALRAALPQI